MARRRRKAERVESENGGTRARRAVRRSRPVWIVAPILTAAVALGVWQATRHRVRRERGLDVLLITIDTLRADAVGAYGNRKVATPWIDRLAAGGVRFDQAHAHNVITLPSHANILSGRYPYEHGIRDNSGFRFPQDLETLATLLKAQGYRTAAFISAFPLSSRFGLARGFDVYDDAFLTGSADSPFAQQERSGRDTVAAALRWRSETSGPTFLWIHLYEPHFPYEPPPPFAERFSTEAYLGEVSAADEALGPILEPLLAAGQEGRTLVILTSDHGESLGEHGEKTHGIFAYEGPLRVPLVVYCARIIEPAVVGEEVQHVDLVPTALDALDLGALAELPGRSLLGARAKDRRGGRGKPTYFEALSGLSNRRWAPLYGLVDGGWKYIELPLPELYDLRSDPKEERNVVAVHSTERDRLKETLGSHRVADRGPRPAQESAETRERLQALGYMATSGAGPTKETFTEEDDPKRLIALDAELHEVMSRRRAGDLQGALALCQRILSMSPRMPLPWLQLAALHREAGRLDPAIEAARQALVLNPDDPSTAALLGEYLNDAGRPRESVDLLEPYATALDPLPEVLMARGAALAQLGRRNEAVTAFERTLQITPTNTLALVNLGTVHLMARDYARARDAFEKALRLHPNLPIAHNHLGVIAAETGRPEDAIAHWKNATDLEPRAFDTLFNLGTLLRKLGRADEARPYLHRFAREAPPRLYARDIATVERWLVEVAPKKP